jgi:propanol-preferring alcohol dehydrogenase
MCPVHLSVFREREEHMKAMVLREFGEPLKLEEVSDPTPLNHEAIVRVKACGVCFTDIKVQNGLIPATKLPHIMGHEIAGEVVEIGREVRNVNIGDRCLVYEYLGCGECFYCARGFENQCVNLLKRDDLGRLGLDKPGGYAEYVKAPARYLSLIPDGVSYEAAAISGDAIATPYHAIKDNSAVNESSKVMVIGAGGLGIHGAQIAKHYAKEVLVLDLDETKLEMAKKLGSDLIANPTKQDVVAIVFEWTEGLGCDLVFDFTGKPETLELSMKCVRNLGQVVVVGYEYGKNFVHPIQQLISREISIMGCRASTFSDQAQVLDLIATGIVQPIIDRNFSLEMANEVLLTLKEKGFSGRAVLIP